MPENGQIVFVKGTDLREWTGDIEGHGSANNIWFEACWHYDGKWSTPYLKDITHWYPLPKLD